MVVVKTLDTGEAIERELGRGIGSGAYRTVFEFGDDMVAKVAGGWSRIANEREVDTWLALRDTPVASYLCPVIAVSDDRKCVVQRRMPRTVDDVESQIDREMYHKISSCTSDKEEREIEESYNSRLRDISMAARTFAHDVEMAAAQSEYHAYDLHERNIGIDDDGKMHVIDYGNFRPYGEWERAA